MGSIPISCTQLLFLVIANVVHSKTRNVTADDSDCRCNWSWGNEGRGFASTRIQARSVSDGHGGKMIGIVAAMDISRGSPILNVPLACIISQQAATQSLVYGVLSASENVQVKLE
jgi:hypothetical protein